MTFEQWFRREYPLIAAAVSSGTTSPNERWLLQIARKAFMAGHAIARDEARTS